MEFQRIVTESNLNSSKVTYICIYENLKFPSSKYPIILSSCCIYQSIT